MAWLNSTGWLCCVWPLFGAPSWAWLSAWLTAAWACAALMCELLYDWTGGEDGAWTVKLLLVMLFPIAWCMLPDLGTEYKRCLRKLIDCRDCDRNSSGIKSAYPCMICRTGGALAGWVGGLAMGGEPTFTVQWWDSVAVCVAVGLGILTDTWNA